MQSSSPRGPTPDRHTCTSRPVRQALLGLGSLLEAQKAGVGTHVEQVREVDV